VLTVDGENGTQSELYNPATANWSHAGSTGNPLFNSSCGGGFEMGPAVLRPGGTVFAIGGLSYTSIYNSGTASWSDGPQLPSGLGVDDGPAAILPDGNVLLMAAPYSPCYSAGSKFFEFNGTALTQVPAPPNAPSDATYVARMLVLPTGQVLLTDGTSNVQVYTPTGTYQSSWQPVISSVASTLTAGSTYTITGIQFNGLTQGAMYGDDAQMATNYPLVRITNTSSGHVFYARTHNHSTMAVATGSSTVSTQFDVPACIESGPSSLVVVANGIPSLAVSVTITGSICDTATITEGGGTSLFGTYAGYKTGGTLVFGSISPTKLADGKACTAWWVLGNMSTISISGFTADPGVGWLVSATAAGVTKQGASGATYSYSAGVSTWTWNASVPFGFTPVGTVPVLLVHH
jgi:hypothetical protein